MLIRNAIFNTLAPLFRLSIGILLTPMILNKAGAEVFSTWKSLIALVGLTWIFQLGLNSYLTRVIPTISYRDDRLPNILKTFKNSYFVFSILLLAVGLIIWPSISGIEFYNYLVVLFACVVFTSFSFQRAILTAKQEFKYLASIDLLSIVFYSIYIFSAIFIVDNIRVLEGLLYLGVALQKLLPVMLINKRVNKQYRKIDNGRFDLGILCEGLRYSIGVVLFTVSFALANSYVIVLFTKIYEAEGAASYLIAHQVVGFVITISMLMLATIKPEFSRRYKAEEINRLRGLFVGISLVFIIFSISLVVVLPFVYPFLIEVWINNLNYIIDDTDLEKLAIYSINLIFVYYTFIYLSSISKHSSFGVCILPISIALAFGYHYLFNVFGFDLIRHIYFCSFGLACVSMYHLIRVNKDFQTVMISIVLVVLNLVYIDF